MLISCTGLAGFPFECLGLFLNDAVLFKSFLREPAEKSEGGVHAVREICHTTSRASEFVLEARAPYLDALFRRAAYLSLDTRAPYLPTARRRARRAPPGPARSLRAAGPGSPLTLRSTQDPEAQLKTTVKKPRRSPASSSASVSASEVRSLSCFSSLAPLPSLYQQNTMPCNMFSNAGH